MEQSELILFGITISGVHPDLVQKRYCGVALHIEDAMNLVQEKAIDDGWSGITFEDITKIADVSFAPWLSKDYEENESEAEPCQP